MQAKDLVEDFNRKREGYWREQQARRRQEQAKRTSPRNPYASNLNLECEREVVLGMTNWQDRPDPNVRSSERMEDGNVGATATRRYLEDLGYEVIGTETAIDPHRDRSGRVALTGRIDFKIVFGGRKLPIEVKTTDQYVYEAVDTFEDLDRFWWTRKWKSQALVYLLQQDNEPEGILLLRYHGQHKMIPVVLEDHLEEAEAALKMSESAVKHYDAGTLPPFTKDPTVCRHCDFFGTVCQPPIAEQGALMLDPDGELYEQLVIVAENEEAHRRYEAAKKRRNEILKAIVPATAFTLAKAKETFFRGICGDFAIALTKKARKGYTVKDTEYQEAEVVRASVPQAQEVA